MTARELIAEALGEPGFCDDASCGDPRCGRERLAKALQIALDGLSTIRELMDADVADLDAYAHLQETLAAIEAECE